MVIFGFFVFVYGSYIVFQKTLFSNKYVIKVVKYTTKSVDTYDDPYIYDDINKKLSGENFFAVKYFYKGDIQSSIIEEHPVINSIDYVFIGMNTVLVSIEFQKPEMLVKYHDKIRGVISGYTFQIYSGNKISSGIRAFHLPDYVGDLTGLDGMFFDTDYQKFKENMQLIFTGFQSIGRVVYIVGGQKILVEDHGKRVFLNTNKNIVEQIRYYNLLKDNYQEFNLLKEIDLGSLSDFKIIGKK